MQISCEKAKKEFTQNGPKNKIKKSNNEIDQMTRGDTFQLWGQGDYEVKDVEI